ncbi:MAG: hypothetical protein ACE5HI_14175 [bacterium]
MSDTIWAAIIGVAGTLGGVGLGLWWNRNATQKAVDLSFKKATDLIKQQDFFRAAGIFKSAFNRTREIVTIDKNHNHFTFEKLQAEIVKQHRALVRFEIYLPPNRRSELWKAWEDYSRQKQDDFADVYFTKEQIVGADVSSINEKQLILDRMDKVLHFTDPLFVFGDNANV